MRWQHNIKTNDCTVGVLDKLIYSVREKAEEGFLSCGAVMSAVLLAPQKLAQDPNSFWGASRTHMISESEQVLNIIVPSEISTAYVN